MEETKTYFCMIILPGGAIEDKTISEIPKTGNRISIENKGYYIVEAHESVIDKFDFVMTLGW